MQIPGPEPAATAVERHIDLRAPRALRPETLLLAAQVTCVYRAAAAATRADGREKEHVRHDPHASPRNEMLLDRRSEGDPGGQRSEIGLLRIGRFPRRAPDERAPQDCPMIGNFARPTSAVRRPNVSGGSTAIVAPSRSSRIASESRSSGCADSTRLKISAAGVCGAAESAASSRAANRVARISTSCAAVLKREVLVELNGAKRRDDHREDSERLWLARPRTEAGAAIASRRERPRSREYAGWKWAPNVLARDRSVQADLSCCRARTRHRRSMILVRIKLRVTPPLPESLR